MGTPKWMSYKGKSQLKMDDLGVPPFQDTPNRSESLRIAPSVPPFHLQEKWYCYVLFTPPQHGAPKIAKLPYKWLKMVDIMN